MEPVLLNTQLVFNGVAVGCIYGLVALGFVLIYKATEVVNFAQGELLMLGAFFAYTYIGILGLPYWLGALLAIASMAIFGGLLDRVVMRPVIGQPTFAYVMLTIGLGIIIRAVATMIPGWGVETYSIDTPYSNAVINVVGLVISVEYLFIVITTCLLVAVLYVFFSFTRLGVAMQASSQNQLAAYYMGIPVKSMFSMIWGISASVAAIAGILLAPVSLIDTSMGFIGLKAFPAAVLGGFGSIPGALVGGVIIGVIESLSGFYLPAGFKDIAAFLVLLVVLIVRPEGLFGTSTRKRV